MNFQAVLGEACDHLQLAGDCRMDDLPALESRLRAVADAAPPALTVDLVAAGAFDIGPAWLLHRLLARLAASGTRVSVEGAAPRHFAYLEGLPESEPTPEPVQASPAAISWLADIGRALEARARTWYDAFIFGGQVLVTAGSRWTRLRGMRLPSVVRHVYEAGVRAVPVVALAAFLISVSAAYIGAQQLRPFGAEIYTVDLVAIGVMRELGVLLTAIMVAGRTGSAFAAELGVKKLNDEVDALESMGLNPLELLVLPRVLGLVIAMPLLTVVADAMGLAGGAVLTRYLFDLPWPQFVTRLDGAISDTTFWAGLVKAPVFGLVIALTGTLRGLQVRDSARELGRLTTVAVVQSIFLVILVDAMFAILFLEIDF
ncbi:MAG: ABC transporter permease [Steroidobacteraceae bacterium]|nr:ABC transporter permease [Steroidobacteraceae bacterium]